MLTPREVLVEDHRQANALAVDMGKVRLRRVLTEAAEELKAKLATVAPDDETFSVVRMRATLAQIARATRTVQRGLKATILEAGTEAAGKGAANAMKYLVHADEEF